MPTATRSPDTAIRPLAEADLPALKAAIGATGLFPPELLDGMVAGHLAGETAGEALWLTATDAAGTPIGLAYAAAERMTRGTWNLLLIAVHPDRQQGGVGTALLRRVEALLSAGGVRVLLVETSGLAAFEPVRGFYRRRGFAEEGRIREFYDAGEDKVIFRKALPAGAPRPM